MDITSIERKNQSKTSTFLFRVIFRQRVMNVGEGIPVPDTSFRLTFLSNFNSSGPFEVENHSIPRNTLKQFLQSSQTTEKELLRNIEEPIVFPPQVKIFFRDISQQIEDNVYDILDQYQKAFDAAEILRTKRSNENLSGKLKVEAPKIWLGDSEEAEDVKEWAQAEIDAKIAEVNLKIMDIAISAHDRIMRKTKDKLWQMAIELPTEASELWMKLHNAKAATMA